MGRIGVFVFWATVVLTPTAGPSNGASAEGADPERARAATARFSAWFNDASTGHADMVRGIADMRDPATRGWLRGLADGASGHPVHTPRVRSRARFALAQLRQPPGIDTAEVVRAAANGGSVGLVEEGLRLDLIDARTRRQLRAWPGLDEGSRYALAAEGWERDRRLEDADWLAQRLEVPHHRVRWHAMPAVLLHGGGDERGTAWLLERLETGSSPRDVHRAMHWIEILQVRPAGGFALAVSASTPHTSNAVSYARLAMQLDTPGAAARWVEAFDRLETLELRRRYASELTWLPPPLDTRVMDRLATDDDPTVRAVDRAMVLAARGTEAEPKEWRTLLDETRHLPPLGGESIVLSILGAANDVPGLEAAPLAEAILALVSEADPNDPQWIFGGPRWLVDWIDADPDRRRLWLVEHFKRNETLEPSAAFWRAMCRQTVDRSAAWPDALLKFAGVNNDEQGDSSRRWRTLWSTRRHTRPLTETERADLTALRDSVMAGAGSGWRAQAAWRLAWDEAGR